MKYNELKLTSHVRSNRVGRGISAGQGKTAGRGTKGQGARAGSSKKPGFAGGSNPLMQKLPKLPGFHSSRPKPQIIFISQLEAFSGKVVDAKALSEAGLIASPYDSVKVLSRGELKKKVSVKLPGASQSAVAAIESAGGSFEKTARLGRPKTKTDKQS
jgi:large subunit ribosomal protein L15